MTVDRDYVIESIRTPQAKIVKGFEDKGLMTPFPEFSDEKIDAVIEYLKTLKD